MTEAGEHTSSIVSGATSLVFITDRWGYTRGGINVFNVEICSAIVAVSQRDSVRVMCAVQAATAEQQLHAAAHRVELIVLDQSGADGPMGRHRAHELVALATRASDRHVAWWIGHDVVSGALAHRAAELVPGSRCAIFHHMNYEAYKGLSGASVRTRKKTQEQRQVLASADVVFAVGPKLARSAQEKTSSRSDVQVVQVIPGLSDVKGLPQPAVFSAITFGRLTPDTDLIKQASLAVEAFASATDVRYSPLGLDARITVVGLSADSADEEHKALLELASRRASRAVPVNAFPYSEDRESLLDELRRHSVCLMLSLHEGFGLTGWEAIAAEVPLIVSKNSGLFETIENLLGGQGLGCIEAVEIRGRIGYEPFQEADHDAVLDALLRVAKNPAGAKRNAATLKSLLSGFCTWENAAETVIHACGLHEELLPTARSGLDESNRGSAEATESTEPCPASQLSDPGGDKNLVSPASAVLGIKSEIAPPLDLWTPGPSRDEIVAHYAPLVGDDTAQELVVLSESAIAAVGAGDFAAQLDVGQRLLALGTDNKYLQAEGAYLSAEGFRLLADVEQDPSRAAELQRKALEQYRIASELLPTDPRPLRGIGRTLEVRGQYDEALRAFTDAKGLCLTHLARSGADQRPDVAHETLRTTRHLIHCILDIRNTNALSDWNRETNTRLLEGYLFESDEFHRQLLPRFSHSKSWWLIEWFMGFVFLARAWGDVGNTQRMRYALGFALEARRKLMDSEEPLSTVERSNLRWWLAVARERAAAFTPRTRQLLDQLRESLDKNDSRLVFRLIDDILLPAKAPWAGKS